MLYLAGTIPQEGTAERTWSGILQLLPQGRSAGMAAPRGIAGGLLQSRNRLK